MIKKRHIIFLFIIILGISTLVVNPYKIAYNLKKPLTYHQATEDYVFPEGYPPGEDIPVAKSIADIQKFKSFTIEVSQENIESSRYFKIKDGTEAINSSSKVGRIIYHDYVADRYSLRLDSWGNFLYNIRHVGWNYNSTSYGEWCVVTLDSGERVVVFVDLSLFDIPKDKKIKLPIGEMNTSDAEGLGKGYDTYDFTCEDTSWYVDMVGRWEDKEVGDIPTGDIFWFCFMLAIGSGFYCFYKYLDEHGYGTINE